MIKVRLKHTLTYSVLTGFAFLLGYGNAVQAQVTHNSSAQTRPLEEQALDRIRKTKNLIKQAKRRGIDTLRDKMTIRVAEVFLEYANWDENNKPLNTRYFSNVSCYKDTAQQMSADLPDFERGDVIAMLDETIAELQLLLKRAIHRTPSPDVNWADIKHVGDRILYDNRPVFLADYSWKPATPQLQEYFGQQGGFFMTPSYVSEEGTPNQNVMKNLKQTADQTAGFVFFNHRSPPQWAIRKYGKEFINGKGMPYTDYDIDNPGAREMISSLISAFVPDLAGTKATELGYMLCNEPRWINYKDGSKKVSYSEPVTPYTIKKFKAWLQTKHKSIRALNAAWHTQFKSFSNVTIETPIDISLMGTAQWYDWVTFNQYRVTDWVEFMKKEILKHDPKAKVHLKIMPSFFTDNDPCTGIDFEALTELSQISGNDCAAQYNVIRKNHDIEWKKDYIFGWKELFMGYDFLKSVKPDQIIFNTESHFLSTGFTRDLYMNPAYVRACYWAAHILGMNASQTWFWPRREDLSIRSSIDSNAYGGSNNQQPRVTREIHATIMDLNSFSSEITEMQRQRKPIRIFYSKTSAAQRSDYMDGVFEAYEALNFEGVPLGFATQNIITKQKNSLWDIIVVHKTERVTRDELASLQSCLDRGGSVVMDDCSLKMDEYGEPLPPLQKSSGILLHENSLAEIKAAALDAVKTSGSEPEISIDETNTTNRKTCFWRCIKNKAGRNILSVINIGKNPSTLSIKLNGSTGIECEDLLKGISVSSTPELQPHEVYFVEIQKK